MSHFSQIKTQIRDLTSLQAALNDLGMAWKSGPQPVRGYRGQTQTADVVIEQDNGYDIGFSRNEQGYELVADLQYWQQPLSVQGFLNRLTQRYAYHAVLQETTRQGFQLAEQQQHQDGDRKSVV